MPRGKKFTAEQIIGKLCEAEAAIDAIFTQPAPNSHDDDCDLREYFHALCA
jgi:hypothetical protein